MPSWWLLAALPPLLGWGFWRLCRHLPRCIIATRSEVPLDPLRKVALVELAVLAEPYGRASVGPWLQTINGLFERVCRARWPDSGSHALSDHTWPAFLDNCCPAAGLIRWTILVGSGHRADCTLDNKVMDSLDAAVTTWIRKHT